MELELAETDAFDIDGFDQYRQPLAPCSDYDSEFSLGDMLVGIGTQEPRLANGSDNGVKVSFKSSFSIERSLNICTCNL